MRKNNRATRAARFLVQFSTWSAERRSEIFSFEVLTTTRAVSCKPFILCLYVKAIRAKLAKVRTVRLLCTTWPTWKNRKTFNPTQSSILMRRFRYGSRLSFLNSLTPFSEVNSFIRPFFLEGSFFRISFIWQPEMEALRRQNHFDFLDVLLEAKVWNLLTLSLGTSRPQTPLFIFSFFANPWCAWADLCFMD